MDTTVVEVKKEKRDQKKEGSTGKVVYSKSEMEFLNKELEAEMDIIEDLLTHLFNARQRAKIKLRWPLKKVYIVVKDAKVLMALRKLNDLFLDQANTKELIFLASDLLDILRFFRTFGLLLIMDWVLCVVCCGLTRRQDCDRN